MRIARESHHPHQKHLHHQFDTATHCNTLQHTATRCIPKKSTFTTNCRGVWKTPKDKVEEEEEDAERICRHSSRRNLE